MSILYDYDPDQSSSAEVPSPCVNVCRMDEKSGLCAGCYRNIDEIIRWGSADAVYKKEIWREIKERMFEREG
jgi:predicted Fe-S protein YdhL (DUF1289 family)